jgi:S1-C subfamily serine protease
VSQGIVAAKARVPGATVLAQRVVDQFFNDTAVGAGASGGPLLDLDGRVIGVNVAVAGASRGLSIAIPASLTKLVVSDLLRGAQQARASLGLEVREDRAGIVRVVLVTPASAAEAAGVRPRDEIVSLNGRKIHGAIDFQSCVFTAQAGASAKLEIVRDGRSHLHVLTTSPLNVP